MTDYIFVVAGIAFGVSALVALIRIIIGPTLLDRMVASDMLVTTVMLGVGAEMVYHRHLNTLGLMVALAATSVLATVMVARQVRKREKSEIKKVGEF